MLICEKSAFLHFLTAVRIYRVSMAASLTEQGYDKDRYTLSLYSKSIPE